MTVAITLNLPNQLYEQAISLAKQHRQNLESLLIDEIAKTITAKTLSVSPPTVEFLSPESSDEPDEAVEREKAAYIALHPFLKENFFGKHVAIYQSQLIDYDDDYEALYERIDAKYPDTFVWLDTVSEEPIEMITLRSPVFIEE